MDDIDRSALLLSNTNNEIEISYVDPPGWADRRAMELCTYIDDMNGIERLNIKSGVTAVTENRQKISIHAKNSERFFTGVEMASNGIGMKINPTKTQLLCISPAGNEHIQSYVRLANTKITSTDELKICGFRFGSKPTVENQVVAIEKKFNTRIWALRNLKRSGFKETELKECYISLIRPVFDYTAVVYHSLLTADQSTRLERLQKRAMKIICGIDSRYTSSLTRLNVCLLYTSPSPRDRQKSRMPSSA